MTRSTSSLIGAIALWLTACPAAADLSSTIETCRLGANEDYDYLSPVSGSCPEAIAVIETFRLSDSLGEEWRDELTYWQAEELESFESYYASRFDVRVADPAVLDRIVEQLDIPEGGLDETSAWERFKEWLRDLMRDEEEEAPPWLEEWLSDFRIPQSTLETFFWIVAGSIIIGALVVVANEIRAARTGVAAAGRLPPRELSTGRRQDFRLLSLEDLDSAAMQEKPAVLLRLLVQRMEQLGIVPRRPATTHQELARQSGKLGAEGTETLAQVTHSAERVRYGDQLVDGREVEQLVDSGVALLRRMEAR